MAVQRVRIIGDLKYGLLVVSQMKKLLEILGRVHWDRYLVQIVDLIEAPTMVCYMVDLR